MTAHIQKLNTDKSSLLTAQSRAPSYSSAVKTDFLSHEVLQKRSDIRAVGSIKEPRRLLGADGPLQPVIDASSIGRNGATFAGGTELISYDPSLDLSQPLMGLTLGAFLVSAPLQTAEAAKRCMYAGKIGDTEGQGLALASLGITVPLTGAGATALAEKTLRVYDMVQTLQNVSYEPVAEVSHSISVLGNATLVLIALYNATLVLVSSFNWYRKSQMRAEVEGLANKHTISKEEIVIENEPDLKSWLDQKFDVSAELGKKTEEEFIELALEEGEKWLSKIEKDWKALGLEPIAAQSKEARKELVEKLLMQNKAMGIFMGVPDKEGRDLLIALGKKLETERLHAREEQKLSRVLGPDIVDKYKKGEAISKAELLEAIDKGITKNQWLILLGVLGVVAAVCAIVFTGGIGALCVSLLFVLSAILWAYGWDRHRLMNQWNGQETGKFDKVMLIASSLLNIVAVAGTIAGMVIFTGGIALVPLLLLIGVGLFWCIVNARGWYVLARHTNRPWEYEKVVSLRSFHKLVQQEENAEKIDAFFRKMSANDQSLFQGSRNWKKVTEQVIGELAANRVSQLEDLNSYSRKLLQTL